METPKQLTDLEELGMLAASIEHDIKNPLIVIDFELQTLRSKLQAYPEFTHKLERIEEQLRRIHDVVRIIPLFRGEVDFNERMMKVTDLHALIHRAVREVKQEKRPENIYFKISSATRAYLIRANSSLIESALVNILKNAVEAIYETGRKHGVVDIKLVVEKVKPPVIRTEISDNGCGISEENIRKVTDLFTTKKHLKPNSGIGLYIAAKIIKMHDGQLEFRSEIGKGTSVSITLPHYHN